MRIVIRKDVYEELMKSYITRWGYPGHYRYKYYEPDTGSNNGGGNSNNKKISSVACPTTPQKSGVATSTQSFHHNNISFLDNLKENSDVQIQS